jgi:hypothetical protein
MKWSNCFTANGKPEKIATEIISSLSHNPEYAERFAIRLLLKQVRYCYKDCQN